MSERLLPYFTGFAVGMDGLVSMIVTPETIYCKKKICIKLEKADKFMLYALALSVASSIFALWYAKEGYCDLLIFSFIFFFAMLLVDTYKVAVWAKDWDYNLPIMPKIGVWIHYTLKENIQITCCGLLELNPLIISKLTVFLSTEAVIIGGGLLWFHFSSNECLGRGFIIVWIVVTACSKFFYFPMLWSLYKTSRFPKNPESDTTPSQKTGPRTTTSTMQFLVDVRFIGGMICITVYGVSLIILTVLDFDKHGHIPWVIQISITKAIFAVIQFLSINRSNYCGETTIPTTTTTRTAAATTVTATMATTQAPTTATTATTTTGSMQTHRVMPQLNKVTSVSETT